MKQRDLAWFLTAPLLVVLATGILGGCAFHTGDMTIISGENVGLNPEPIRRSVEGTAAKTR